MRTTWKAEGAHTAFLILDLDDAYHAAVGRLGFTPVQEGFARHFRADRPHLARSYANFARYAEEMILQEAGVHIVPWEHALEGVIRLLQEHAITWWLVGSTALAARGLAVLPGDIDLIVDEVGGQRLTALVLDSLLEPISAITTPGAQKRWGEGGARAVATGRTGAVLYHAPDPLL